MHLLMPPQDRRSPWLHGLPWAAPFHPVAPSADASTSGIYSQHPDLSLCGVTSLHWGPHCAVLESVARQKAAVSVLGFSCISLAQGLSLLLIYTFPPPLLVNTYLNSLSNFMAVSSRTVSSFHYSNDGHGSQVS